MNILPLHAGKNNDWYVGTINNHEPKNITGDLGFLNEGNYTATIFSDATDAVTNPNNLIKQTRAVTKNDKITLQLAGGGGQVMILKRQ
jgi:alpha-glucosidase